MPPGARPGARLLPRHVRRTHGESLRPGAGAPAGNSAAAEAPIETAAQNGIDIHAGLSETSRILFVKPGLVSPQLADAQNQGGTSSPQLLQIALDPAWPGYFGAPRHATASYGAAATRYHSALYTRRALSILDGKDEREIPRYATATLEAEKEGVAQSRAYDETVRKRQADWLKKNGFE